MKVSIAQARSQLSKILSRAAQGEEVVITDRNEPKFRIVPIASGLELAPESRYEQFMKSFKPIRQKRGARSVTELVREERDEP